mmetsp:Transcript_29816/g.54762  ORF Transcript_29816/g.54762 Transcript_29816/m.54762 type:complete len:194 (-) Transcript_29816:164-745(-)
MPTHRTHRSVSLFTSQSKSPRDHRTPPFLAMKSSSPARRVYQYFALTMAPFSLALSFLPHLAYIIPHVNAIGYDSGPCMQEAYERATGSKGDSLKCTSNDIRASFSSWEGPAFCTPGEFIHINITSVIKFKRSLTDFTSYTSLVVPDAINGMACAAATLGPADGETSGGIIRGGIGDPDDADSCYDVRTKKKV